MNHIRKALALFLILLTYGHALSQQQPTSAAPAVPAQPQSTPTPAAAEPSAATSAPSQTPATPESTPAKPADTKPTDQPVPPAAPPVTTTAEPAKPPVQETQKAAASGPGLSVKNNTEYPATLTLTITPGTQVIQKDIPAKQTVELLHEPLSNTATYIVSGSLFKSVTTKTTVTVLSGPTSDKKPKEFINTNIHRIASSKNWSATNLAGQTVELVLELIEKPGSEPLFEINQSPAPGKP